MMAKCFALLALVVALFAQTEAKALRDLQSTPPAEWTCPASQWNDEAGICECKSVCGVDDVTCTTEQVEACRALEDLGDLLSTPPAEWTCPASQWNDEAGICECKSVCGVDDVTCTTEQVEACRALEDLGDNLGAAVGLGIGIIIAVIVGSIVGLIAICVCVYCLCIKESEASKQQKMMMMQQHAAN